MKSACPTDSTFKFPHLVLSLSREDKNMQSIEQAIMCDTVDIDYEWLNL